MKRIRNSMKAGAAGAVGLLIATQGAMAAVGAMRMYFVDDPVGRNVVSIESRAPLETIVTRTSAVTGELSGDPADIFDKPQARFEIDLNTLETGIKMRDEHMKSEAWLDAAKFPKAVWTLKSISPTSETEPIAGARSPVSRRLADGVTTKVSGIGELELHGVTKPVSVQLEITPTKGSPATSRRLPGDLLHVRAAFSIKLDDFGIKMPAMAKAEVANEQQVIVDIFAGTEKMKKAE